MGTSDKKKAFQINDYACFCFGRLSIRPKRSAKAVPVVRTACVNQFEGASISESALEGHPSMHGSQSQKEFFRCCVLWSHGRLEVFQSIPADGIAQGRLNNYFCSFFFFVRRCLDRINLNPELTQQDQSVSSSRWIGLTVGNLWATSVLPPLVLYKTDLYSREYEYINQRAQRGGRGGCTREGSPPTLSRLGWRCTAHAKTLTLSPILLVDRGAAGDCERCLLLIF